MAEANHRNLVAIVLGQSKADLSPEPSAAPVGLDGGYRPDPFADAERKRRETQAGFARLFEPAPTDADEVTYALPPLRR